jgi:ribosome biogenesis GTPase
MVVRKSQGQYWVRSGERTIACSLSNRLRKQLIYPIADPGSLRHRVVAVADIREIDPVAIGDVVRYVDAGDGSGQIAEVLPRRNKLVRRAAGNKPLEQVIVANVDQVVAVFAAAHPAPTWELLDRYLAAAESRELPAVICITKLDLAGPGDLDDELANYERIGYPVILTSAVSGDGIDRLREQLRNRLSVVVGKSGVGKTSLLNAVQPGLGLNVNEVSEVTGKGKHTTTALQLFDLDVGGSIVDTPGMREFGLWNVAEGELAALFPELQPLLGRCRFGANCRHDREPGCAVREAVYEGKVSERRWLSYLRLRATNE